MKKILSISLLSILASCSGYTKIGETTQHGNFRGENPVKTEQVLIEKDSNYAFWIFYIPILLGVGWLTWKTFKPTEKTNS